MSLILPQPAKAYDATNEASMRRSMEQADAENTKRVLLASTGGAALVGFLQAGSGAVLRPVQSKLREVVTTRDFKAEINGATDDTAAVAATIASFTAGGEIRSPHGTTLLTDTQTFAVDKTALIGENEGASIFKFQPTSAKSCLKVTGSGSQIFENRIEHLGFTSTDTTYAKTAIELVDASNATVSRINIASGAWPGTSDIGIRTRGRQRLNAEHLTLVCARPFVMSPNPNQADLATDHGQIRDAELSTTISTGKCLEIETGTPITNLTLGPGLAMQGGKYGLYCVDSTSIIASYKLHINGGRCEQGADATGYSIYLDYTGGNGLQDVHIQDFYCDSARNGIYIRNAFNIILDDVTFAQTSGTLLNITGIAGTVLFMRGIRSDSGATVTLTNLRCIQRLTSQFSGSPISEWEVWVYDDGTVANQKPTIRNGQAFWEYGASLASPGQLNIPVTTAACPNGATVEFEIGSDTFRGRYLAGTVTGTGTANVSVNASGGAGKYSILDAGGGQCTIISEIGSTKGLTVRAWWLP